MAEANEFRAISHDVLMVLGIVELFVVVFASGADRALFHVFPSNVLGKALPEQGTEEGLS